MSSKKNNSKHRTRKILSIILVIVLFFSFTFVGFYYLFNSLFNKNNKNNSINENDISFVESIGYDLPNILMNKLSIDTLDSFLVNETKTILEVNENDLTGWIKTAFVTPCVINESDSIINDVHLSILDNKIKITFLVQIDNSSSQLSYDSNLVSLGNTNFNFGFEIENNDFSSKLVDELISCLSNYVAFNSNTSFLSFNFSYIEYLSEGCVLLNNYSKSVLAKDGKLVFELKRLF